MRSLTYADTLSRISMPSMSLSGYSGDSLHHQQQARQQHDTTRVKLGQLAKSRKFMNSTDLKCLFPAISMGLPYQP